MERNSGRERWGACSKREGRAMLGGMGLGVGGEVEAWRDSGGKGEQKEKIEEGR